MYSLVTYNFRNLVKTLTHVKERYYDFPYQFSCAKVNMKDVTPGHAQVSFASQSHETIERNIRIDMYSVSDAVTTNYLYNKYVHLFN